MRIIDADELIKDKIANDPVVIAVNNAQTVEPELPLMPIDVASMIINAKTTYETNSVQRAFGEGDTIIADRYSKNDLREIAIHLLVYCQNEDEE